MFNSFSKFIPTSVNITTPDFLKLHSNGTDHNQPAHLAPTTLPSEAPVAADDIAAETNADAQQKPLKKRKDGNTEVRQRPASFAFFISEPYKPTTCHYEAMLIEDKCEHILFVCSIVDLLALGVMPLTRRYYTPHVTR